jgi:hypothetical protein
MSDVELWQWAPAVIRKDSEPMRKIIYGAAALAVVAFGSLGPAMAQMSGGITLDHQGGRYDVGHDRKDSGDYDRKYSGDRDHKYGSDYDHKYGSDYDRKYGGDYDRKYSGDRDHKYDHDYNNVSGNLHYR